MSSTAGGRGAGASSMRPSPSASVRTPTACASLRASAALAVAPSNLHHGFYLELVAALRGYGGHRTCCRPFYTVVRAEVHGHREHRGHRTESAPPDAPYAPYALPPCQFVGGRRLPPPMLQQALDGSGRTQPCGSRSAIRAWKPGTCAHALAGLRLVSRPCGGSGPQSDLCR